MAKHKTPRRDPKTGKFLTKAQIAARKRARKPAKKPRARAREAAPAAAAESKKPRKSKPRKGGPSKAVRKAAAAKAARTRARNEREHQKKLEAARRKRSRTGRARDQLTTQRQGTLSKSWRTGRYPKGHPRAGQFKSTAPGSGSVHDNPLLTAAENPLGVAEWFIGTGSIALGAIGLSVIDRIAATVPLKDAGTKDANGNEQYTDPGGASGSPYAGMTNAAAYAAPMGLKRWLIAGAVVATPMVGGLALAYFTHDGWPKLTAFLNFTGMGAFGYVLIKSGSDALARLLRGTAFGQRTFDVEIRAQALKAGSSYTGPVPPSTGLGRNLACGGDCGCGPCRAKRTAPPAPPSFGPPANEQQQPPAVEPRSMQPAPQPTPRVEQPQPTPPTRVPTPSPSPTHMAGPRRGRFPMDAATWGSPSELQ